MLCLSSFSIAIGIYAKAKYFNHVKKEVRADKTRCSHRNSTSINYSFNE